MEDIKSFFGNVTGVFDNADELISHLSGINDDSRLMFDEWHRVITGYDVPVTFSYPDGYRPLKRDHTNNMVSNTKNLGYTQSYYQSFYSSNIAGIQLQLGGQINLIHPGKK